MKKTSLRRRGSLKGPLVAAVLAAGLLLSSSDARAQYVLCESPTTATSDMRALAAGAVDLFGKFLLEISIFIDNDIGKTATAEILDRLDQYDMNIYPPLTKWWDAYPVLPDAVPFDTQKDYDAAVKQVFDGMSTEEKDWYKKKDINDCPDSANNKDGSPYCVGQDADGGTHEATSTITTWKAMTRQLSIAKIDQTRQIGSMLDARLINERIAAKQAAAVEARARYAPAETTCQLDFAGSGQTKMYYMARALTRAIAREDTLRRLNYVRPQPEIALQDSGLFIHNAFAAPPPRGPGGAGEIQKFWVEYSNTYCDATVGDQGCAAAYTGPKFPGGNRNIAALLWGDKQTIDLSLPGALDDVNARLRYLISPFAPEPIPGRALGSMTGRQAMAERWTYNARINTIYNVLGQMVAERAGGSGVDIVPIKGATGLPTGVGDPDTSASYASLRNALSKSRYLNPAYVVRLVNSPNALVQEQGSVNAIQAQLLNDLIKRNEEMVFMEAASYADDLDGAMPARPSR